MLIIANLDCERAWAGLPPEPSLRPRLSQLGALLALLGEPGDIVWTSTPVDESDLHPLLRERVGGFVSGPLPRKAPDGAVAWGVTDDVANLLSLSCAPHVAARANDRRLTMTLPGARIVGSAEALREHLAAGGASASPTDRWVVKAPHGTAGRARLRGRGADVFAADRQRLARLLADHGELVFEPWMDVIDEWGAAALLTPDGDVVAEVAHEQVVAGGGAVRTLRPRAPAGDDGLGAAAVVLREVGYHGPFGVDGYRHRDAAGAVHVQAVGEINARLTFGVLAHMAVGSLGKPGQALHIGTRAELVGAGDAAIALLTGAGPAGVAAWLA